MEGRFQARVSNHLKQDYNIAQHRREEFVVDLRKSKRNISFSKKRVFMNNTKNRPLVIPDSLKVYLENLEENASDLEKMQKIHGFLLKSPPADVVSKFLMLINQSLSNNFDLSSIIHNIHMTETITNLIKTSNSNEILHECLRILSFISIGPPEFTSEIVKNNGISLLLSIVSFAYPLRLENTLWTIGNILNDSADYAKDCFDNNILEYIQKITSTLHKSISSTLAEALSLVLRNLALHCEYFSEADVEKTTEIVIFLLDTFENYQLGDCVLALNNLSKNEENIESILQLNAVECVKMHFYKPGIVNQAFIFFATIIAGKEEFTMFMLNCKVLDLFCVYMDTEDLDNLKQIIISLGNIAACNEAANSTLLMHDIFPAALKTLCHPNEKIRLESSFLLKNFFLLASENDQKRSLEFNLYSYIAEGLNYSEPTYLLNLLTTVYKILLLNSEDFAISNLFCQSGSLASLQALYHHPDKDISQSAEVIYNFFFESSNEF